MKQPTRIVIFNVHSTLNAGDRALLECTVRQLQTHFPQAQPVILANHPEEDFYRESGWEVIPSVWVCCGVTQRWPILKQILAASWGWFAAQIEARLRIRIARGNWRRLFDAYHLADLVVGVAGNQFYSTGRFGWPFPVTALAPELGHIFSKPVYIMPQSLGPLNRTWERRLLHNVYRTNRIIQVRDAISMQVAREIHLPAEKVVYVPDIAFDFPPAPKDEAVAILKRYGFDPLRPAIGATIIADPGRSLPSGSMEIYYAAMAEVLRRLGKEYNLPVYLFIQVSGPTPLEDDRLGTHQVLSRLGDNGSHIRLVDAQLTPAQLKACYGCMDLLLPTRMHSGIFAMTMGVPCVFVGYLTKTRGVLQSLGLEDWMVQVGSVDIEELWRKVETAWLERNERASRLKILLPPIIANCRRAGEMIKEDFELYGRKNPGSSDN